MVELLTIVLAVIVIAALAYAANIFSPKLDKRLDTNVVTKPAETEKKPKAVHKHKVDITAKNRKTSSSSDPASSHAASHHPLIHRHLRGHTQEISSISWSQTKSSYILSTSADQTLRVWLMTEDDNGTGIVPYVQVKCQNMDYATAATFSHDDSHIFIAMAESRQIQVYKVSVPPDDSNKLLISFSHSFPTSHKEPITCLRHTSSNVLLTLSKGLDTYIHLYNIAGSLIKSINVAQLVNYELAVILDGRFFAVASKLTDVKIWEIKQKKGTKEVDQIDVVMTLKGHKRGIHSLAFSTQPSLSFSSSSSIPPSIVTASVDGSLRCWNLNVRYQQGEDPKPIWTIETGLKQLDIVRVRPEIISKDGAMDKTGQVCISSGTTFRFYSLDHGDLLEEILDAHTNQTAALEYRKDGQHLASYAKGTKAITIWNSSRISSKKQ